MRAMLLSAYQRLEMVEVPTPNVGAQDVLVRVQACGICGSDIHGWDGSTGRRRPPLIMGHEAAGQIAAVGKDVRNFSPGDRVTFDSTVSCGTCENCRRGRINLCLDRQVLGVSCDEFRRDGAFAEYVVVPQNIVYHLPESLPYEHAALIESVSIAVHGVSRARVPLGGCGVVVGAGMIGLLVIQALRHAGCSQLIAIDQDADRLELARQLGATDVCHSTEVDPVSQVHALTGGRGGDVVMEVVGIQPTIDVAVLTARRGGQVVLVGNVKPRVEIPLQMVVNRELTLLGSCASNGEYPECIRLMESKAIDVSPLITATSPLREGPLWFERLYRGEPGAMKVVLKPNLE